MNRTLVIMTTLLLASALVPTASAGPNKICIDDPGILPIPKCTDIPDAKKIAQEVVDDIRDQFTPLCWDDTGVLPVPECIG